MPPDRDLSHADRPLLRTARSVSRAIVDITWVRWSFWLLLAAWFLGPALALPYHVGKAQDWAYFNQHATSAWLSWTVYGQLPQWEPFSCGGIPAIGNLQGTPVGLTQLCAALFGLMPGQRIASLLFVLLGLEGGFLYARHRGAHGFGALAAGVLFGLSGRFVQLFHDGQPVFLSFELLPWALLCLERGWRQWRFAVAGSFVMALLFLEGGAVPTPLVSVLLGFMVLLRTGISLWRRAHDIDDLPWWRPMATLGLMATITLGLTLWRILPVAESLIRYPRVWHGVDNYSVGHVLNMLLRQGSKQGYTNDGSSLVGMGAALLFAVALIGRDKRTPWLFALTVVCLDLATGRSEGLSLFPLLKAMPVLENLRNPFRFGIFAGFFIAIGAGVGISVVEERLLGLIDRLGPKLTTGRAAHTAHRAVRLAGGGAAFLTLGLALGPCWQLATFGHGRLQQVFIRETPRHVVRPFQQGIGNRWVADVWPAQHRGSLSCFEEQPFPQAPGLRADRPQEAFLDLPSAGTVTQVSWSPHRIVLDVALERPARLLVNQNYHRGWGSSVGEAIRHTGHIGADGRPDGEGLIAVALPAGRRQVVLRYSDPLVLGGLGATALTLILLGVAGWRRRRSW